MIFKDKTSFLNSSDFGKNISASYLFIKKRSSSVRREETLGWYRFELA
jgi:hypothetical protein